MNQISIQTEKKGTDMGDLFGIFFEDINHSADGGLYGELVQNRSFEFAPIDHPTYHALMAWEKVEQGGAVQLTVQEGDAVSSRNPHYLHMEVTGEKDILAGVRNVGFGDGMYLEQGKDYLFSCYVRCNTAKDTALNVRLLGTGGELLAEAKLQAAGGEWQQVKAPLQAQTTTEQGSLVIALEEAGAVDLDMVSLFPKDTFLGRENGMRKDLALALKELQPKFMRFPGGCLVHDGSLNAEDRDSMYRWKNTIGDLTERPARRSNWRYNQTLGLGYYEYFLFCEDIGAKPMPILPAGYDPHHKRAVPFEELGEWIQEALDLIEFANGGEDTKWGAIRAGFGHPEPFGLEYLGVGNEEVGEGFRERFPYFADAIHAKYPQIRLIGSSGPFCAGEEYDRGWKCAVEHGADYVDEHYYMSPEWFLANMHRYDDFQGKEPYVFLGEYASCSNTGKSALTEAAYMVCLQNASHAVKLACYAPLLCHKDYVNWRPDMIWFDNHQLVKSVNYEVQKLFMNHQGEELLPMTLQTGEEPWELITLQERKAGGIGFWGNESRIEFSQIRLRDTDTGETQYYEKFEALEDKVPVLLDCRIPENFTLRFHARETRGWKGFRLYFGRKDEENNLCWILGGWENQDTAIAETLDGKCSFLTQNAFSVERERDYACELRVQGSRIEAWLDGTLLHSVDLKPIVVEPLYVTSSREEATGDIIVKAVNLREEQITTQLSLPEETKAPRLLQQYQLLESDCSEHPDFPGVETGNVTETKWQVEALGADQSLPLTFPPRSLTVLRIK